MTFSQRRDKERPPKKIDVIKTVCSHLRFSNWKITERNGNWIGSCENPWKICSNAIRLWSIGYVDPWKLPGNFHTKSQSGQTEMPFERFFRDTSLSFWMFHFKLFLFSCRSHGIYDKTSNRLTNNQNGNEHFLRFYVCVFDFGNKEIYLKKKIVVFFFYCVCH